MANPISIRGLHHYAYRCRDAEETRAFYEDILELPLSHVIRADNVPSTGEHCPYVHIFFQMRDGSYMAFFDLGDDEAPDPSPNTPAWVNHIALEVDTVADLEDWKAKLEAAGIDVVGVTDHHFLNSIYFFDPNGHRLELTTRTAASSYLVAGEAKAHDALAAWTEEKRAGAGAQAASS